MACVNHMGVDPGSRGLLVGWCGWFWPLASAGPSQSVLGVGPGWGGRGYGMVWYALRYREWLAGRSLTLPVFRAGVRGQLAVTRGEGGSGPGGTSSLNKTYFNASPDLAPHLWCQNSWGGGACDLRSCAPMACLSGLWSRRLPPRPGTPVPGIVDLHHGPAPPSAPRACRRPPRRNSGLCHVCTGGKQHKAQKENGLVSGL